jgi:hypothetical protein
MNYYQYFTGGGGGGGGGLTQIQVRSPANVWTDVGFYAGDLYVPVTNTFGNPLWVTGSVTMNNPGGGGGGGTVTATIDNPVSVAVIGTPTVTANQGGIWTVSSIGSTVTVSQTNTPAGTASVSMTNFPTAANPINITASSANPASVYVVNSQGSDVRITGSTITMSFSATNGGALTASVSNFPAVQQVTSTLAEPLWVTGTTTVTGTFAAVFSGTQIVTSSLAAPVWVTGTTVISSSPSSPITVTGTVTATFTASVPMSMTNFPVVTATFTGNLPLGTVTVTASTSNPASVFVVNSQGSDVRITGTTITLPVSGVVTATFTGTVPVSMSNPVNFVTATLTGAVNTVPTTPNPTQFYPVRLTDGTSYYNATGGGGGGGGNTVLVPPINNPNTASLTLVNQVASITTLVGANSNRVGYQIFNDSSATLYVYYGTNNVDNSQSLQIGPKQVYESAENVFVGNIYGQWVSAGSGLARVTEYTNNYGVTGTIIVNQGTGALPDTLTPWQVTFPQYSLDAFGGVRVSPPYTLFDMSNKYGIDPEVTTSGSASATVTADPANSAFDLTVTAASGSYARARTNTWFKYQAGRGQRILQTVVHPDTGKSNQIRRWGYFDDNDGLFWQVSGTNFGFVRRTSTSGAPVETFISQSAFNVDKVDGTGQSGLNLDITKGNIYEMQFQWLGVGNVELYVNGIPVHVIRNPNTLSNPYIKTAVLPCSWEVQNMAASTASSMKAICANVTSEGGNDPPEISFGVRASSSVGSGIANEAPLIAIRQAQTVGGIDNRIISLPRMLNMATTTKAAFFRVIANPTTITGGTWVSADSLSAMEVNSGSTGWTGGSTILASYLAGTPSQQEIDLTELFHVNARKLRRDAFTGEANVFLVVGYGDGGSSTVVSSVTWEEIR